MFSWIRADKIIANAYRQAAEGKLDDAIALLRRSAESSDPAGDRHEAMANLLYERSRYMEAAKAYEAALQPNPQHLSRLYYYASALARSEEWDRALEFLSTAEKQMPESVMPNAARCLILAEKPDHEAARAAYEAARRIFAANPAQDSYAMGLLEQCGSVLAAIPPTPPEAR